WPLMNPAKIRCTTAAACSSMARACCRLPSAALAGLGCGPMSMSRYPYGGRPPYGPALDLRLGGHRGAEPDLDPVPLAFGDTAEHGHDQVVGLVVRVDGAADLGHPQRDAPVGEQREGVAELVAVERPLRLADHHRVEPALPVRKR